ncbi:hypothetical protein BDW42DRAFT_157767 [Aspergillus taichungensis]|uniref:Uncharacterized protein n=1 Tax=Aspergillus taichungensis TaxID=482145 RepID=A0A2J5IA13_9EURO|nr:hypothetical protein BDW42DRAFT_157767 [Aspergillus taichungensis]
MSSTATNLTVDVLDYIGVIKLHASSTTEPWTESLLTELITALRELDDHPRTVLTVITSEGPFRLAATRIRECIIGPILGSSTVKIKQYYMRKFSRELLNLMISHHKDLAFALDDTPVWGGPSWVQGAVDLLAVASRSYIRSSEANAALQTHNAHGLDSLAPALHGLLEDIDRLSDLAFGGEDTMAAAGWRSGTVLTTEELRCALDAATASTERSVDWAVLDRFLGTMQHIASAGKARGGRIKSSL